MEYRKLTPDQRETAWLQWLAGWPVWRIASTLGVTERSVYRVIRAKKADHPEIARRARRNRELESVA